jgi:hypothetical protein
MEQPLTAEPLQIDVIIIKKKKDVVIDKAIAGIFRGYNILEFKSHTDSLSEDDFYKVYAYACLYKGLKEIEITDITITFVGAKYPEKVVKHLEEIKGYKIKKKASGIYEVEGGVDKIPVQFIKTNKLSEEDSGYLRLLSDGLNKEAVRYVMDEAGKPHKVKMGALVNAILRANAERFKEVMAMGGKTLEEVLEESGLTAKWEDRGEERAEMRNKARIEKIVRNLIKKGLRSEEIAEMTEIDLTDVLSLREQCEA